MKDSRVASAVLGLFCSMAGRVWAIRPNAHTFVSLPFLYSLMNWLSFTSTPDLNESPSGMCDPCDPTVWLSGPASAWAPCLDVVPRAWPRGLDDPLGIPSPSVMI